MRINPTAQNKPYYKRNIRGPMMDNTQMMGYAPGMGMPQVE